MQPARLSKRASCGRGVALLWCQKSLDKTRPRYDEKTGIEIVRRALEEPIRIIAQNAARKALSSSAR